MPQTHKSRYYPAKKISDWVYTWAFQHRGTGQDYRKIAAGRL